MTSVAVLCAVEMRNVIQGNDLKIFITPIPGCNEKHQFNSVLAKLLSQTTPAQKLVTLLVQSAIRKQRVKGESGQDFIQEK